MNTVHWDGTGEPDPLRVVLHEIERRAAHPAYRGQARRAVGVQLVDTTPDADAPTFRVRCLACPAEFVPGDPEIKVHHQTHREEGSDAKRGDAAVSPA